MRRTAVITLVLMSGCMDAAPESTPQADDSMTDSIKPGMEWSDCTSMVALAEGLEMTYPYPAQPPGWSDPPPPEINEHYLNAASCERVQWGPFERGPVFTLFESLAGALAPDSCLTGPANRYSHLGTLWISDAEIAAYINATLDVPVHVAEFEIEENPVGPVKEKVWSWGLPGEPRSHITMIEADEPTQPDSYTDRIFWFNETTLSYIDLEKTYEISSLRVQATFGRMEDPMVAASSGIHEYVGFAGTYLDATWSGGLHQFKDHECKEQV